MSLSIVYWIPGAYIWISIRLRFYWILFFIWCFENSSQHRLFIHQILFSIVSWNWWFAWRTVFRFNEGIPLWFNTLPNSRAPSRSTMWTSCLAQTRMTMCQSLWSTKWFFWWLWKNHWRRWRWLVPGLWNKQLIRRRGVMKPWHGGRFQANKWFCWSPRWNYFRGHIPRLLLACRQCMGRCGFRFLISIILAWL